MRKLFFILTLFISFAAKSQVNIGSDGRVHSSSTGGTVTFTNELITGSDTTTLKNGLAWVNGTLYTYYGGKWNASSLQSAWDSVRAKNWTTWNFNPLLGFTPLNPANNLADVTSITTSRSNLQVLQYAEMSLPTLSAMMAYSGFAKTLFISDSVRGGTFNFKPSSYSLTVDSGVTFPASGGGYWVRQLSPTTAVSVKWFQNVKGDGSNDDTRGIQKAIDFCYGPASAPNGNTNPYKNYALFFPSGHYEITSPLLFTNVSGATIFGASRQGTLIQNIVNDSDVVRTNGFQYSHVHDISFSSGDSTNASCFNLDWQGSGSALQSNSFEEVNFSGGLYGVLIGASGYMGSENIFKNCFWNSCYYAVKTQNYNALDNLVIGGNIYNAYKGLWAHFGSINANTVSFQNYRWDADSLGQNGSWDIQVDNSSDDIVNITGCRSESTNFAFVTNGVICTITSCTLLSSTPGVFVNAFSPTVIVGCLSKNGIVLKGESIISVRNSYFGNTNWLADTGNPSQGQITIDNVQVGLPNEGVISGNGLNQASNLLIGGANIGLIGNGSLNYRVNGMADTTWFNSAIGSFFQYPGYKLSTANPSNGYLLENDGSNRPRLRNPSGILGYGIFSSDTSIFSRNNKFETLSNKTISGSSNTFSNISNGSLTNSSVTVTAGTGLSGGGTVSLGSTITLTNTITQYTDSLARAAQNTASTSVTGLLTSTDWNTFNGKQAALGFTPYNATNPSNYIALTNLSFTAGSGAYNNITGVITIPTNTNQLTNGAGFISSYTETDPIVKAINGIVKSNGTTISAATAGTDYVTPSGSISGSAGSVTNSLTAGRGWIYSSGTTYNGGSAITGNQDTTISLTYTGGGSAQFPFAAKYNGTPYSAGTATTNKPLVMIETSGATSTGWSTSGTLLGVNGVNAFSGNLIDAQKNGTSVFNVNTLGTVTAKNFMIGYSAPNLLIFSGQPIQYQSNSKTGQHIFLNSISNALTGNFMEINGGSGIDTSGNINSIVLIDGRRGANSGTGQYNAISIATTAETNTTFSGFVRALYYNPTGTIGTGFTHVAFENTKGTNYLNTVSDKTGIGYSEGATLPSLFSVNGSVSMAYISKGSNYTATSSDYTIEVTGSSTTITLPTAVGITGRIYTVVNTYSGSATVATTSSQTIAGSTTYSLSAQYKYISVQSNGANWLIIANN